MSREAAEAAEPVSASVQAPGAKGSRRCSVKKATALFVRSMSAAYRYVRGPYCAQRGPRKRLSGEFCPCAAAAVFGRAVRAMGRKGRWYA